MIIALGRQHGSNGHLIAHELAERLNYRCFDKEIVDKAAEDSEFSREIFTSFDEKKVSPYVMPTPHYATMGETFRLNMQVAAAQFEAIRKLAEEGDCIFVGRCADYVLRQRKDLIRVFIMANDDYRTETMMARNGISREQAAKIIRQVDKDRSSYYKYYTDQVWGDPKNYDCLLDSSQLNVGGCADVLYALTEARSRMLQTQP